MNHSFAFPLFTSCCYLSGPGTARWQEREIIDLPARAMHQRLTETFAAAKPTG